MKISIFNRATDMPQPLYYQAETFVRITWADDPDYDMDAGLEEPAVHIALHQDNTLYSYGSIIRQDVILANETFTCYGVRSVFTFPASRRQGYAHRIMVACEQSIRSMPDADVALLWTENENRHFYEKAGWTALPNMITLYGEENKPDTHHEETAMMIFLSQRALQQRSSFEYGKLFVGEEPW
ncbi:MAG: GNAT family N-acetyltransferase [Ardenticatenaceae bacterium]|nr:GNAT family N-acetyltransferase [Ardenticatenaceae bacterium]